MMVKRSEMVETTNYNVEDIISFELADGEKVEAMAMKQEADGMIFMLVDCLKDEECMNEDESVEQFAPMKLRRNRIAFQGHNGNWEWYWLANKHKRSASNFAFVTYGGNAYCHNASGAGGVRPAFKIKNL